jgi:hypothetical protein
MAIDSPRFSSVRARLREQKAKSQRFVDTLTETAARQLFDMPFDFLDDVETMYLRRAEIADSDRTRNIWLDAAERQLHITSTWLEKLEAQLKPYGPHVTIVPGK